MSRNRLKRLNAARDTIVTHSYLIRRNGFSGYFTRGFFGSEQLKSYHPQHVARLPNKADANGNMRAYFAVTQSNLLGELPVYTTDGSWMIIQTDADAYDRGTDRVVDTPGSDGEFVFEEHFNDDVGGKLFYALQDFLKGAQFVVNEPGDPGYKGDWVHPRRWPPWVASW